MNYDFWLEGGGDPLGEGESDAMYDFFVTADNSCMARSFEGIKVVNPTLYEKVWLYDFNSDNGKKTDLALVEVCEHLLSENFDISDEDLKDYVYESYKDIEKNEIDLFTIYSVFEHALEIFRNEWGKVV